MVHSYWITKNVYRIYSQSYRVKRKETLLVHCDLGIHTSFCIVLAYMMTKRRLRLRESVLHLQKIRRQLKLGRHTRLGLEAMERSLDSRKLRRLDGRLRKAPILAIKI